MAGRGLGHLLGCRRRPSQRPSPLPSRRERSRASKRWRAAFIVALCVGCDRMASWQLGGVKLRALGTCLDSLYA
eukprot:scaffold123162_cov66-Phaeocystis_antarctica.AAC.1